MKEFDIPLETFQEALRKINKYGEDPTIAIPQLMKNNRILAFGERHSTSNPQRDFGAAIMPELDRYMSTGQLDSKVLPILLRDPDYLNLLEAARKNGIKIIAVDSNVERKYGSTPYTPQPIDPSTLKIDRDQIMADNISTTLGDNPNSKIIFWVGSFHISHNPAKVRGTADWLRSRYSIATIMPEHKAGSPFPLVELAVNLTRPVVISTNKAKIIGDFPMSKFKNDIQMLEWDYVVIYPQN